ncbi:MAG: hypothetical protein Q8R78_00300 [Candidatus Omnitrophota bacterium]|nr:hypothetical protein [Candidatus Omnitrophota bacterium]
MLALSGVEGSLVASVHAETLRDPFTFSSQEGAEDMSEFVLIGVLWDEAHPLAIVGDENVGIGDRVMSWQIVEIQPDRIVVQRGDRRETVSIGNSLPRD